MSSFFVNEQISLLIGLIAQMLLFLIVIGIGIAKPQIRMVSIGTMLMANQLSGQSNISF